MSELKSRGQSRRIAYSSPLRLPFTQALRRVASHPHGQPLGNPIQRHRRFVSQSPPDFHLFLVPLSPPRQLAQAPLPPPQLLSQNPFGTRFRCLLTLGPSIILLAHPLVQRKEER